MSWWILVLFVVGLESVTGFRVGKSGRFVDLKNGPIMRAAPKSGPNIRNGANALGGNDLEANIGSISLIRPAENGGTQLGAAENGAAQNDGALLSGQEISAGAKLASSVGMSIEEIKEVLPHRFPFLLVDRVLEIGDTHAIGVKQITGNEDPFNGHFPHKAIFPGVLQIEALAQLAGLIALRDPEQKNQENNPKNHQKNDQKNGEKKKDLFLFAGVDGVKWKRPVLPGDTLILQVNLDVFKKSLGVAIASAKAYVDGQLACDIKAMKFAILKQ